MKNILIITMLIASSCNILLAQHSEEMKQEKRYVEVTGIAEMEVVPNEIFISITLQEEKDGEKRSVEQQEKVLEQKLQKLNIDLSNLKLSNIGAYTHWDRRSKESYNQKSFELKLINAAKASQVLYELNQLEIYRMYVSNTDHTNIQQFRKQVKIDAVQAAKEKATYLLEAVGENVGDVIFIKEIEYGNYYGARSNMVSNARSSSGESYKPNEDVEFQPIKLQYKIQAQFEIK